MKVKKWSIQKLYLKFQPDAFTGPVAATQYDTALYLHAHVLHLLSGRDFLWAMLDFKGKGLKSHYTCVSVMFQSGE